jgi:hypothetical protein
MDEIRFKSGMPDDMPVATHHDLCLALGGDDTSFTGDLLRLIAKADPGNRARLGSAFPLHVTAWGIWMHMAPHITAGQLRHAAAEGVRLTPGLHSVERCECGALRDGNHNSLMPGCPRPVRALEYTDG